MKLKDLAKIVGCELPEKDKEIDFKVGSASRNHALDEVDNLDIPEDKLVEYVAKRLDEDAIADVIGDTHELDVRDIDYARAIISNLPNLLKDEVKP